MPTIQIRDVIWHLQFISFTIDHTLDACSYTVVVGTAGNATSTGGMYVVQLRGNDSSFAIIWSRFIRSFKRNGTFASGSTQRTTSPQSFSVSYPSSILYFANAACAFCNVFNWASLFLFATFTLAVSLSSSCCFWARIVTPALPIRDSQKFHCPDAEKAFPLLRSCSTCAALVAAVGIVLS